MCQDRSSRPAILPLDFALLATVAGAAFMLAVSRIAPEAPRAALFAAEAALLFPAFVLMMMFGIEWQSGFGLVRVGGWVALLSILAGALFWLASLGLMEMQTWIWRPDPVYVDAFRRLLERLRPHHLPDALLSIAAISISPAFFEEALCRGILLPAFQRHMRRAPAIAASAFLFALIHLDPFRMPFTFFVGLGLGALRVQSGSLWPPFLAHATLNTITYSLAMILRDPNQPLPMAQAPLAVLCFVLGALTSLWTIRQVGRRQAGVR
jgi:membrane protease YdiL (CAAX protease family)